MANDFIAVSETASGPKVDTSAVTVGANLVERQRIVLADDVAAANFARITAAGEVMVREASATARANVNFFMNVPAITTATDALQPLLAYRNGAAVTASTTPAVVATGKTLRLTLVTLTYVAVATAGSAKFTLRLNAAGVVAIGSPAVCSWIVGGPAAVAGVSQTVALALPDGVDLSAGAGLGVSMQGLSAVQAAAAVGYGHVALHGFEY